MAANDNGQPRERRLVRIFAGASLLVHLFCLLVGVPRFFFPTNQITPELDWAIEADLISDIPVPPRPGALPKEESIDKEAALPEVPPPPPQLPDIKVASKPEAAKEEALAEKVEKPKAEPKKEKEQEKTKKLAQDESYKNQLFDKLLRDRKQEVNQESKEQSQDDKKRAELAKKIAILKKSLGVGTGGNGSAGAADYRQVLTKFIQENYRIPDAYNYGGAMPPVVSFTVSAAGQMQGLSIVTSSGHQLLDHFVLQSMEDAAGFFPKPPSNWVGREINVRFKLP